VPQEEFTWQSKLVLLAVLPFAGTDLLLDCAVPAPDAMFWALGLSTLLGALAWRLRAVTPAGAAVGAILTASLMFSTSASPYLPWRTALIPALAVAVLAFAATHVGRRQKEGLGTAERRRGRNAAQIAANLGVAALAASAPIQAWLFDCRWLAHPTARALLLVPALAALAEAAADTVSSEVGQVMGGRPRLITTLRMVEPGQNGAVTLIGSLAGFIAAALVAGCGAWALRGNWTTFAIGGIAAIFGLFFDSLLGAAIEDRGWLNNDAVNFLSTAAAAGFALALLTTLH
jgi:uncharacterized protein (TIGR00297 family)